MSRRTACFWRRGAHRLPRHFEWKLLRRGSVVCAWTCVDRSLSAELCARHLGFAILRSSGKWYVSQCGECLPHISITKTCRLLILTATYQALHAGHLDGLLDYGPGSPTRRQPSDHTTTVYEALPSKNTPWKPAATHKMCCFVRITYFKTRAGTVNM